MRKEKTMGMFKDRVLLYLEGNLRATREIRDELRTIREEKETQTTLLERMMDKTAIQVVASAPKAITWREAARVLAGAAKGHCKTCELQKLCAGNFRRCAEDWEVPGDE
jgi:hypothetical protein